MAKQFHKSIVFIWIIVTIALLFACSSGSSDGGDEDLDQEFENEDCQTGELKCDSDIVLICQNEIWNELENCEELGMHCDSGRCIDGSSDGDDDADDIDIESDSDGEQLETTEIDKEDTTSPQVTSTSPADGTQGVDINFDTIAINFTEEVDDRNVNYGGDIDIYGGCSRALFSGKLSKDKMQIELNILYPLEPNMTYQVVVKEGVIKDLAGNTFGGITFSFTTKADAEGDNDVDCEQYTGDHTPPEVQYSFPSDGEYSVDTDLTDVRIVFTERIRVINYVPAEKITVTGNDDHKPELGFEFSHDVNQVSGVEETTLLIKLKEDLHDDTSYTVVIEEGLIDLAENPLGEYSMSFSTGEDPNPDGDLDIMEDEPEEEIEIEIEAFNPALLKSTRHIFDNCPSATDGDYAYSPHLTANWVPNNTSPLLGELTIVHEDVMYDYNIDDISVNMDTDIWSITLTEIAEVNSPSGDNCLWDVEFVIHYLLEGTYTVTVKSGNGDPDLQTQVTITY